jgi:hypothetical protein
MVTEESATYTGFQAKPENNIPFDSDHRQLVKFRTPDDSGYNSVKERLKGFVAEIRNKNDKGVYFSCSLYRPLAL